MPGEQWRLVTLDDGAVVQRMLSVLPNRREVSVRTYADPPLAVVRDVGIANSAAREDTIFEMRYGPGLSALSDLPAQREVRVPVEVTLNGTVLFTDTVTFRYFGEGTVRAGPCVYTVWNVRQSRDRGPGFDDLAYAPDLGIVLSAAPLGAALLRDMTIMSVDPDDPVVPQELRSLPAP